MSWCDKLASTPPAGFLLDWHFASSNTVLEALAPNLDKLVDSNRQLFSVVRQDAFSVAFNTDDGFSYGIEPSRVSVAFFHSLRAKAVSGGPPILQMLSQPRPYTELLSDITNRLTDVMLLVPGADVRKINRVGIVTTTIVDEDEVPPGIARFIRYLGRPWPGPAESFSYQSLVHLARTDEWVDKCQHNLAKAEKPGEPLTITFDWHRTFTSGKPINSESLTRVLRHAKEDALNYFEELGEGDRFDVDIDGAAT